MKHTLSLDEMEAQSALELPERELLWTLIIAQQTNAAAVGNLNGNGNLTVGGSAGNGNANGNYNVVLQANVIAVHH